MKSERLKNWLAVMYVTIIGYVMGMSFIYATYNLYIYAIAYIIVLVLLIPAFMDKAMTRIFGENWRQAIRDVIAGD